VYSEMKIIITIATFMGLIVGMYQYWKGSKDPVEFEEKTIKIEI